MSGSTTRTEKTECDGDVHDCTMISYLLMEMEDQNQL